MTAADLTAYLHSHIPITAAMGVTAVLIAPDRVVLAAPIGPNINHRATVFGGSASALAILAAWALVHLRLQAEGLAHQLVIHRNSMGYDRPITTDFLAEATISEDDWPRFLDGLTRRGRARIAAHAALTCEGVVTGRLDAEFVAIRTKP